MLIKTLPAFRCNIERWGRDNFRKFPWRYDENPYHILLSEVLLHRTQAKQVIPAYTTILSLFPDVRALAAACPATLSELFAPLGLHWRAPLLLSMATRIVQDHSGSVPCDKSHLIALPGVGSYIASAVRCFAFHLPEPLLDTNTVRVLSRLFCLPRTDSSRRSNRYAALSQALVDPGDPQTFNYALIDLGALVCTPTNPTCDSCPVVSVCCSHRARDRGQMDATASQDEPSGSCPDHRINMTQ